MSVAIALCSGCGGAEARSSSAPANGVATQVNVSISAVSLDGYLQLQVEAEGQGTIRSHVSKLELLDAAGKKTIQTLKVFSPTKWTGDEYGAWDETLEVGAPTSVSYRFSGPDWKLAGGEEQSWSQTYRVRVTFEASDKSVDVVSDELMREPPVVT